MIEALILLALLSPSSNDGEQVTHSNCPAQPVPGNYTPTVSRPSTLPIFEAGIKTRMRNGEAFVLLEHDAAGNVTRAFIDKSSGNKRLDAAILKWAADVKVQPGACGFSRVSASFSQPN
jgi:TonB family protein